MEYVPETYLIVGMPPPLSDLWAPSAGAFLRGVLLMDSLDRAPSLGEPHESVVHGCSKVDGLGLV